MSTKAYWRLEDTNAEVGPDLNQYIGSFDTARFFNGYKTGPSLDQGYLYTKDNGLFFKQIQNEFISRHWKQVDYDSAASGNRGHYTYNNYYAPDNDAFEFLYQNPLGTPRLNYRIIRNGGTPINIIIEHPSFIWSVGDKLCFVTVFDPSGIAGTSDTLRLYFGKSKATMQLVYSTTQSFDPGGNTELQFLIGNIGNRSRGCHGRMDDLFFLDQTDQFTINGVLKDVDVEGIPSFGPPDKVQNVVASDGTSEHKVDISWDINPEADTYNLYRSLNNIQFDQIASGLTGLTYEDFTAVTNKRYYYGVTAVNPGGESLLSDTDIGWVKAIQVIPPYDNKKPRILILGKDNIDIWKLGYVSKTPPIEERKTYRRDKVFSNRITIRVQNFDEFFSVNNPEAIFSDIDWQYGLILIWDKENNLLWNGLIEDIKRDHQSKTAEIISVDHLYKVAKKKIVYKSSGYETPAMAFMNICDLINFTYYDYDQAKESHDIYQANNCFIKCNFKESDELSFQQIIEKLGEVGCADVYSRGGIIHFKHYTVFTGGVTISINESDLKKKPRVYGLEKDIINDYAITYEGANGVYVTDSTGDNIGGLSREKFDDHPLPDMDCDIENQIIIKDKPSAVYIGNCYMLMTHKDGTLQIDPKIREGVDLELTNIRTDWLTLNTSFKLTLKDENWVDHVVEVFRTKVDIDSDDMSLSGIEV